MSEFRFLHKDSAHGYTDRPLMALPNEPEAVSEEEQRVISLRSRSQFAEMRGDELRRRDNGSWLERLRKAEMRADSLGINIFREQAFIRQQILAIENRLQYRGTFVSA